MMQGPSFLVEWEPRWQGFKSSIKPALSRSGPPLLAECNEGMKPGRSTVASFLVHGAAVLFVVAVFTHALRLPAYVHVDPYENFDAKDYHVIYYRGQNLPEMTDAGGAQAGLSGKSGGRELYHPTQTIRIARGNKLVDTVVDAPSLKLPRTNEPVANLLSLPAGPAAAPPMAGWRSAQEAANLAPSVAPVPAAPSVQRDRFNGPEVQASVVEPPPNAPRQVAGMRLPDAALEAVPAAVTASPRDLGYTPKLQMGAPSVVEPAPNPSLPVGSRNVDGPAIASVQQVDVVPPAPAGVTGGNGGGGGTIGSALKSLSSMIGSLAGSGTAPGGGGMGLIVSANPGGTVGVPANGEPGSLAMSPAGGREPGMGGSGGGTGIGNGTGPGSGSQGSGPGAAAAGTGLGAGALRPGTTMGPGTGGSGSGRGNTAIPGVTIRGGHVSLPSFATASSTPGSPSHTPAEKRRPPAITIIATSRSGGALNLYGALKGAKVYTIYIDTQIGMAVFQYAERANAQGDFQQDLTAPEPMASDVPGDIPKSRVLLSCMMDKSGALKNIRVLESTKEEITQRVVAALTKWRFRPVLRGDEPVDVDAIVGFNIDTR